MAKKNIDAALALVKVSRFKSTKKAKMTKVIKRIKDRHLQTRPALIIVSYARWVAEGAHGGFPY